MVWRKRKTPTVVSRRATLGGRCCLVGTVPHALTRCGVVHGDAFPLLQDEPHHRDVCARNMGSVSEPGSGVGNVVAEGQLAQIRLAEVDPGEVMATQVQALTHVQDELDQIGDHLAFTECLDDDRCGLAELDRESALSLFVFSWHVLLDTRTTGDNAALPKPLQTLSTLVTQALGGQVVTHCVLCSCLLL
jgi:hypothetical protein